MQCYLPKPWLVLCLLVCLSSTGCVQENSEVNGASPNTTQLDKSEYPHGKFLEPLEMRVESDGESFTLTKNFGYIDPNGNQWKAPAGSKVDGASIPRAFYSVVGSPMRGKYRMASVVHDVACVEKQETWKATHRMFYDACLCGGVSKNKAKLMYWAVYHFGDRWQLVHETKYEQVPQNGDMVERPYQVVRSIDEPTAELDQATLEKAQAFIDNNDPSLIVIENLKF